MIPFPRRLPPVHHSQPLRPVRALHHLLRHPRALSKLPPLPAGVHVFSTPSVMEKKSVFVGHAVRATGVDEAVLALEHILSTKKVGKASHNILAYRFSSPPDEGHDDGGEATGGRKLLRLLELLGAQDVLVVVTRWYGGVQLGPDRFRIISHIAKDALELGGFLPPRPGEEAKR